MSDDPVKTPEEQTDENGIKNLKAEMDRKLDNVREMLAQQNQQFQSELGNIVSTIKETQAARGSADTDLEDLKYSDPDKYVQIMTERVVNEKVDSLEKRQQAIRVAEQNRNTKIAELSMEYPELKSTDSELTIKTLQIYNGMSDEQKSSAEGIELAIRKAASDIGVLPKSKRREDDGDSFSMAPDGSNTRSSRSKSRSEKLDPKTEAFAQLLGLDTSDAKVRESLQNKAKRNYNKWE
jgi:hypothetical protein